MSITAPTNSKSPSSLPMAWAATRMCLILPSGIRRRYSWLKSRPYCDTVCHNLSEVSDVLRMYSIVHDEFHRRRYRWVELENSESFRRPVNPTTRGLPAEAAREAQILRLSQVRLAASQSFFDSPPLAVLLLQIRIGPLQVRIKVGVLQRDRCLGSEQG